MTEQTDEPRGIDLQRAWEVHEGSVAEFCIRQWRNGHAAGVASQAARIAGVEARLKQHEDPFYFTDLVQRVDELWGWHLEQEDEETISPPKPKKRKTRAERAGKGE